VPGSAWTDLAAPSIRRAAPIFDERIHGADLPKVSVVIPTHNRPKLVLEAIESVARQTYAGSIEIVVVFDNAQPHPLEIAVGAERSLKVQTNDARTPGLAGARNTGILASDGAFVAFCDDDDAWYPERLRRQFELLAEYGQPAVMSGGIDVVTDTGTSSRIPPLGPLRREDFLRDRIMEVHPSTLLLPRDVFEIVGLVDEDLPRSYAEDYDLLLRVTQHLPVLCVQEPIASIAFHAGSFYASRWDVIISGLEYLLEKHPDFEEVPEGRARLNGQIAFAHAATGERRTALRSARTALRDNPREKRAYAAVLASMGVPPAWIAQLARRRGRGI
jgi:glycosyltransferase involved in cell wall biosynthesis